MLPAITQNAARLARDVFYIGVGAGVLTAQRAQVQRREWQSQLSTAWEQLTGTDRNPSDTD